MVVRPSFTRLRTCTHEVLPWDTTRNRRITKRRAIAWMIGHGYDPRAMAQLLQPKQQLAGYEVDELVGKGGMGEVYRARQIHLKFCISSI